MNKAISIIVIIAAVLAGGYFLFRGVSQSASSDPLPVQEEDYAVTYTDAGYSPATMTVKKGETVTFTNRSSQSMWTASATHPTHRGYPTTGGCLGSTFDACKGVQPGDSWSFQFAVSGIWNYHNHVNPGDTGTIVVE